MSSNPLPFRTHWRIKPEIGIRAVRTKQVACEVLPLRIYGLTHFLPL
jgi:hypothetical protein